MEPMTNLEALVFSCGEFHYDGKHYVMLEKPYTYTAKDIIPYYTVNAICEDDSCDEDGYRPVYAIRWIVTNQDQIEYVTALLEKDKARAFEIFQETGVNEDTIDCNFDKPDHILATEFKYNVDELRQRFSWQ